MWRRITRCYASARPAHDNNVNNGARQTPEADQRLPAHGREADRGMGARNKSAEVVSATPYSGGVQPAWIETQAKMMTNRVPFSSWDDMLVTHCHGFQMRFVIIHCLLLSLHRNWINVSLQADVKSSINVAANAVAHESGTANPERQSSQHVYLQ